VVTKTYNPVNIMLCVSTEPVLGRCWQHRPSTGPVLACLQGNRLRNSDKLIFPDFKHKILRKISYTSNEWQKISSATTVIESVKAFQIKQLDRLRTRSILKFWVCLWLVQWIFGSSKKQTVSLNRSCNIQ